MKTKLGNTIETTQVIVDFDDDVSMPCCMTCIYFPKNPTFIDNNYFDNCLYYYNNATIDELPIIKHTTDFCNKYHYNGDDVCPACHYNAEHDYTSKCIGG